MRDARDARPRDELGRVLPPGTPNVYEGPQLEGLSVEQLAALGQRLLRERRAFAAHEAWEEAWKALPSEAPEADAYRALSQLAAGACHAQRGNEIGSRRVFARATTRLDGRPSPPGVAIEEALEVARRLAEEARPGV